MKKCKKFLLKNKQAAIGIFVAGILTTGVVSAAYSSMYPTTDLTSTDTEETYSALGYGRGNGQQDSQKQGGGKNSKTSQGGNNQGLTKENCLLDGCLLVEDADYPVGELTAETIGYLEAAIADERKALATYEAVMDEFGNVKPFINIARAEEQHIAILKGLFDKYGVEVPSDTTVVGALPSTLSEVCAVGVQAEIDNDQLYQDMIGSIQEQDIKEVFTSLAAASINMHLPAFERCAN